MMLAARGAIWASGAGLPYDAEVEYLESSGTQYINTGVVPTTTKTEITFSTPTPPSSGYMCGSFNADNNRYYPAAFSGSSTRYINLIDAANTVISQHTNDGNVHTVVYNATGGACYFDGAAAGTLGTTTLTASNPIYLFCTSTSTGASGLVSGRIYSCKLYDANGTLVRDFIPVRKGTVGYLYDRVTRKPFGNAGSGDFVVGQDVVPVEWLEFTGTQRLLTDITPNAYGRNLKTSISYQLTSTASRQLSGSSSAYFEFCSNGALVQSDASYPADLNRHTLDFIGWETSNSSRVLYDGQSISPGGFVRPTNTSNHFTFGSLHANSQSIPLKAIVYSLSMEYQDATRFLYWHPVRVGQEGAMMDVLTRRIYRNAGTGAFTYGNDLKYPIPA